MTGKMSKWAFNSSSFPYIKSLFFHLDIGQFILNLKSGAVGRRNTIFSLTTNLLSEKTVFTEIRWMILKIGSDFYNSLFHIQIRKKYSRKVSWNNFEVKEIFQKTHKLKMFAFWSLWAARAMQTLSSINWKELKKLKQSLQLNVYKKIYSMISYKIIFLNKYEFR